MKFTILTENTANKRGFLAEHGLSLLIETRGKQYLFDCGQSDVYLKNAKKLGISLEHLDGIIFSHGHYDHCGGFSCFPKNNLPKIYIREEAFLEKTGLKDGRYVPNGIEWKEERPKEQVIYTKERHEIEEGITLLGKMKQYHEFEPEPEGFFIGAGMKKDLMEDEQMLVCEEEKGLYVFLGCSHVGIMNCLERVKREFPGKHIVSILAGMHLKNASAIRIRRTIEELGKMNFDYLIPVHCTGISAIAAMKEALGKRCLLGEAGQKYEL